ncbi:MAG: hypothetical protein JW784_04710, partial [Candidatus Cloacimonetes bacterium]|nr:hypothetical protein [Candidatus Cloacimonadota bacterium]
MLKILMFFSIVPLLLSCSQIRHLPDLSSARISSLPDIWNEELEAAAGDTLRLPEVEENIRREAAGLSNRNDDPRYLYLAWQGYSLLPELEDSLRAEQLKDIIRNRYPRSQENYLLASQDFYDRIYPVWTDDSLKVVIITDLLAAYPGTGWRRVMYPYLTYSLSNLDQWEKLQQVLADFRLEYPLDYLPYLQTARYFLRKHQDLEFARENARQALASSYDYPRQPFVAAEQWSLEERSAPVASSETLAAILNR